jgi:hypothetical protein
MSVDSATKLKSAKEIDEHIEPQLRRPMQWQNWRFYLALLRAAARQRPFTTDSLRAVMHVLKRMRWARAHLAKDAWNAVSQFTWRQQ